MAERIYPFAVARTRVLETRLLSRQQLTQMAEAKNAEEAMRALKEAGYDTELAETVHDYEKVLAREQEKTYALMKELVPEEKFMELFLYKNDYHNAKVLIKSQITGANSAAYLVNGGAIPLERLKKALDDHNYNSLPTILGKAVQEAFDAYASLQDGQVIDLILDKACFAAMKQTAAESKLPFVVDYVARLCDITNLKTFYRLKKMKKPVDALKEAYVEGGGLALSTLVAAFGLEQYANAFRGTPYSALCEEGMQKGFTEFERLCDNFMMESVKSAKFVALTVEPLVAYQYARESEIKTVRIIMTGKLNQIAPDTIKERLRDAYV